MNVIVGRGLSVTVVEELYVQRIRHLPVVERLQLISRIAEDLVVNEPGHTRRITELRGLGKEIWRDIDGQAYVDELRDEWEQRQ